MIPREGRVMGLEQMAAATAWAAGGGCPAPRIRRAGASGDLAREERVACFELTVLFTGISSLVGVALRQAVADGNVWLQRQ